MAGLDAETLELILPTLGKNADKKLTLAYLLALDRNDEFAHAVLKELCDPNTPGLHLLFIPKDYGGLDAATVNRTLPRSTPPFGMAGIQHCLHARLYRDPARLVARVG